MGNVLCISNKKNVNRKAHWCWEGDTRVILLFCSFMFQITPSMADNRKQNVRGADNVKKIAKL